MSSDFSKEELWKLILKKPYFAQIELTKNCNFKCKFCFEGSSSLKSFKDKKYEEWISAINKLYYLGVKYLHFSGGECFIYKDFLKILKYCKSLGFKILVNTNGSHNIKEVAKYVDDFVFSVHGLNKTHDEIVGVSGAFKLIEKNIERAYSLKKNVIINTVLIKDNFKDFENIILYFKSKYKGLKYAPTMAIPCKTGNKFDNKLLDLNNNIIKTFNNKLCKFKDNIIYKHGFYGLQKSYRNKSDINLPTCAAGKSKLIIKYNGNVYPCNFFQTNNYLCGNIFTDDIYDIWENGTGFQEFRKLFFEENIPLKCKKCAKKTNCFSGCRAWTRSYINGNMKLNCEGDVRCEFMDAFVRIRNNN